jgi:hypothetical protein
MAFWRVSQVIGLISGFTMVLVPVAFLSALFLHLRILGAVGIVIMAVWMTSMAVLEGFRIWWVLHLGRWTGWKKEPIWRSEQPARYWSRTAMHATILTVYSAWAVLLMWDAVGLVARR